MSLKSMTGYGCSELIEQGVTYRVEIKSLNSRYCDLFIKSPNSLNPLESKISSYIKSKVIRGKFDIFITMGGATTQTKQPQINTELFTSYLNLIRETCKNADILTHLTVQDVLSITKFDGVLESSSHNNNTSVESFEPHILASVARAVDQLIKSRETEGQQLKQALLQLLNSMTCEVKAIADQRDEIQKNLYENYKKRLDNLFSNLEGSVQQSVKAIPEERLIAEIAILTDKADIAEELTRLEAHQTEFTRLLHHGHDVGRKLDFLCQEMHREANTISNKIMHVKVTNHIIALKQGIERLRQQVQNIE